jgi:hypothetical protein
MLFWFICGSIFNFILLKNKRTKIFHAKNFKKRSKFLPILFQIFKKKIVFRRQWSRKSWFSSGRTYRMSHLHESNNVGSWCRRRFSYWSKCKCKIKTLKYWININLIISSSFTCISKRKIRIKKCIELRKYWKSDK